jgi:hypothetical protein
MSHSSRVSHSFIVFVALASLLGASAASPPPPATRPHNVVLFVTDGLRSRMVNEKTAPTLAALRDAGVYFKNSHSLFPTFTTANASAIATGHYLGDTGDFSNTIYTGKPIEVSNGTVTPFLENDAVIGEVDEAFGGDYLHETTILAAAREAGYSTAVIGKLGPTLIFDHTQRSGATTIIVDDSTGHKVGIPLPPDVAQALQAAGLAAEAPGRGANGDQGNSKKPGTLSANVEQQEWFVNVATKIVLPRFKEAGKPFVLVFWSRDPDGSQHNQGDSFLHLVPGISGPTALAGIKNVDDDLARVRATLDTLGLADSTDIVVTADHGFSTISKESATSGAAKIKYEDVPASLLPPGFLAIDLSNALHLPLFDPDDKNAPVATADGKHPRSGNGLIGNDPAAPSVVVAANGGSDLIYLPMKEQATATAVAGRVIDALLAQDYVSGIFVNDSLGKFPGTLPMSAVNLIGAAATPTPSIVVNFKTFNTGCDIPTNCQVVVGDSPLQQGQGMHGSLGRGDTFNFTAAIGPDFKTHFVDPAPVSNADVNRTLVHLLKLPSKVKDNGKLTGRVITEAFRGGAIPPFVSKTLTSAPAENGLTTVLNYQIVGTTRYFDTAGFPGRTNGLVLPLERQKTTAR